MAEHGNDHLVIYGYSQGAIVANVEKRKLAEQYPAEPQPPTSTSCWAVTPISPTAAFMPGSRASTFRSSICRSTVPSRPTPSSTRTSSPGSTTASPISRCIRSTSSPLLNAVLGFVYVHMYPFDVSLPADPTTSPAYQGKHGDTSYYFFETQDLPLFGPLRTLGVPESLIDVVEPFFKVIVDLGYDRSIPPWEPTPARLIPPLDPATVAADLVDAIGEGINNAAALIGSPPKPSIAAPVSRCGTCRRSRRSRHGSGGDRRVGTPNANPTGQRRPARRPEPSGRQSTGTTTEHHQVTSIDTPTQIQQVSSAPAGDSELSAAATPEPSTSDRDARAGEACRPSRRQLDRCQPHRRQPLRRRAASSSTGDSSDGDAGGDPIDSNGRPSTIASAHAMCPSKPSDSAMAR